MNRRKILQLGLVLAATAVLPVQAAPPALKATITLRREEGGTYHAEVQLENLGDQRVDVLSTVGTRPGYVLKGKLDTQVPLAPVALEPERMTRAAPRRLWQPLAAHEKVLLGSCRLRPEGSVKGARTVTFELSLETGGGPLVLTLAGVKLPEA